MSGILASILAAKRREVAGLKVTRPEGELVRRAAEARPVRDFAAALRPPSAVPLRAIAEVKRASPSAGAIRPGADAGALAVEYEAAGAVAVSVLTDEPFFGGSLGDLAVAARRVGIPVLRKDFLIDSYQVLEARAAGADAVLLIVAALPGGALAELLAAARQLGLFCLVEAHAEEEVDRAVDSGARIVGVNQRDLATFTIDRSLIQRMRTKIPLDRVVVAESGIRDAAAAQAAIAAGADAILVGETLMRSPSPGAALAELIA